jgi:hypothetical protein
LATERPVYVFVRASNKITFTGMVIHTMIHGLLYVTT